MEVYHLFRAVVSVIVMLLVKRQLNNIVLLLEEMMGKGQAQKSLLFNPLMD